MTCGIAPSARLEQKPGASLGLIDPQLDQARGGDVAMHLADVMDLTKTGRERLVVFPQFGKHIEGLHVVRVIVCDSLQPRDVADRVERPTAYFANALSDRIGHRKELIRLLIEQPVI